MSVDLYKIMSGVPPSTGGEFKLLYGNRDKMDRSSGLAVWVFDDTGSKIPNLIFSETLDDLKVGYIQNHGVHAGNDFKLIYGNRQKVKLASDKSMFIFGTIADRPSIEGINILEIDSVECHYLIGTSGCQSEGIYRIEADNEQSRFTYDWSTQSANCELTTDTNMNFVKVKTDLSTDDQTFELTCMVIDNMVAQSNITKTFTHTKIEHIQVVLDTFMEASNVSCMYEYPQGSTCEARSTYIISTTSSYGVQIEWSIVAGNAYIIAGQGTENVTIGSNQRLLTENFTLGVRVWDETSETYEEKDFSYTRTMRDPVIINAIAETSNQTCMVEQGEENTCIIQSSYSVTHNDTGLPQTITWSVDNEAVQIVSAQNANNILVQSAEHALITDFTITATTTDGQTTAQTSFAAQHIRTIRDAIEIDSLVETANVGCVYETTPGSECTANSIYTVHTIDNGLTHTYEWEVSSDGDKAVIVSGQGTASIQIATTGNEASVDFEVTVKANDGFTEDIEIINGTHTKSERIPIDIQDIIEQTSETCLILDGDTTCIAQSTYGITSGPIDYNLATVLWTVTGNATIVGNNDTIPVTVQTDTGSEETFDVKIMIDDTHSSDTRTETFTHKRDFDVEISDITEETTGSCEYEENSTCVAASTHKVEVTQTDSYTWTITGDGTIIAGLGTDTVTVESTGDTDKIFTLECTCENSLDSDTFNKMFIHRREQEVVGQIERSVQYDNTNIATEFIA